MKCLNADKPRCLSLKAMDWDDNEEVRAFRGCGQAHGFVNVWKQNFLPNIDQLTVRYSCMDIDVPNHRRRSNSSTPVSLLPASKRARLEETNSGMDTDNSKTYNEGEMDDNIKEHFLGMRTIYHIR